MRILAIPPRAAAKSSIAALASAAFACSVVACGSNDHATPSASPTLAVTPAAGGSVTTPPAGSATAAGSAGVQEFCASIDDFKSSLNTLATSRSRGDVETAAAQTEASAQRLRDAAEHARTQGSASLTNAVDDFSTSLDDAVASDNPVARTISVFADKVTDLQTRFAEAQAGAQCSLSASPTAVGVARLGA